MQNNIVDNFRQVQLAMENITNPCSASDMSPTRTSPTGINTPNIQIISHIPHVIVSWTCSAADVPPAVASSLTNDTDNRYPPPPRPPLLVPDSLPPSYSFYSSFPLGSSQSQAGQSYGEIGCDGDDRPSPPHTTLRTTNDMDTGRDAWMGELYFGKQIHTDSSRCGSHTSGSSEHTRSKMCNIGDRSTPTRPTIPVSSNPGKHSPPSSTNLGMPHTSNHATHTYGMPVSPSGDISHRADRDGASAHRNRSDSLNDSQSTLCSHESMELLSMPERLTPTACTHQRMTTAFPSLLTRPEGDGNRLPMLLDVMGSDERCGMTGLPCSPTQMATENLTVGGTTGGEAVCHGGGGSHVGASGNVCAVTRHQHHHQQVQDSKKDSRKVSPSTQNIDADDVFVSQSQGPFSFLSTSIPDDDTTRHETMRDVSNVAQVRRREAQVVEDSYPIGDVDGHDASVGVGDEGYSDHTASRTFLVRGGDGDRRADKRRRVIADTYDGTTYYDSLQQGCGDDASNAAGASCVVGSQIQSMQLLRGHDKTWKDSEYGYGICEDSIAQLSAESLHNSDYRKKRTISPPRAFPGIHEDVQVVEDTYQCLSPGPLPLSGRVCGTRKGHEGSLGNISPDRTNDSSALTCLEDEYTVSTGIESPPRPGPDDMIVEGLVRQEEGREGGWQGRLVIPDTPQSQGKRRDSGNDISEDRSREAPPPRQTLLSPPLSPLVDAKTKYQGNIPPREWLDSRGMMSPSSWSSHAFGTSGLQSAGNVGNDSIWSAGSENGGDCSVEAMSRGNGGVSINILQRDGQYRSQCRDVNERNVIPDSSTLTAGIGYTAMDTYDGHTYSVSDDEGEENIPTRGRAEVGEAHRGALGPPCTTPRDASTCADLYGPSGTLLGDHSPGGCGRRIGFAVDTLSIAPSLLMAKDSPVDMGKYKGTMCIEPDVVMGQGESIPMNDSTVAATGSNRDTGCGVPFVRMLHQHSVGTPAVSSGDANIGYDPEPTLSRRMSGGGAGGNWDCIPCVLCEFS